MKATVNRLSLLESFSMVSGVVPTRSPKPILNSVKFRASDEGSTLMATDLEAGIIYRVLGVKVDRPGAVILNPNRVKAILSTCKDEELSIAVKEDAVTIRATSGEWEMPTEDPDLFPEVPDFEPGSDTHEIAAADLRRMIRRTMFCVDPDNTRYAMGGVLLACEGRRVGLVGTDGRRLATQTAPTDEDYGGLGQPILPVKALKLIERNLEDDAQPARMSIKPGVCVLVGTEHATIYTRLVDGRFPRYDHAFPGKAKATISMTVGDLLAAVVQASIVTSEESRAVDFDFEATTLRLTSQAADIGRSSVFMPIDYDGPTISLRLDPRYLADALKTLDPDSRVDAELIDHKSAALLRTEDGYVYVMSTIERASPAA